MTDKDNALQHLKELGFDAYSDNGVVMVRCKDQKTAKSAHEELMKLDYRCSFGFKFCAA